MDIPFVMHEAEMARAERTQKRLFIVILVLLFLLLATNAGWLIYTSQFDDVTTTQTVEQDAESGNNQFIGGDFYGGTESDHNN